METIAALGLAGAMMSLFIFLIIWHVLTMIARWKVFTKANISGWKSLIPFYSDYCTYRIAWNKSMFWVWFVALIVSSYCSGGSDSGSGLVSTLISILSFLSEAVCFVVHVLVNIKLSQRFGHGIGFGLGLIFLGPIFTLILGLGDSKYLGNPEENIPPQQ